MTHPGDNARNVERNDDVPLPVRPSGLPPLTPQPSTAVTTVTAESLAITAGASTDWFSDPQGSARRANAPSLTFAATGNLLLSARVSVEFASEFDAGALVVWQDASHWAKLCFEYSPQHEPMVVSVVTRGLSDDCNSVVIAGTSVWLRIARIADAFAFHYSVDGCWWHFVRMFALPAPASAAQIGFLAQSPAGDGCTADFSEIRLVAGTLANLRSGE